MSSINSSDRSRYTEEVRNQREDYQNREAENIKKQKKEIRRLNQAHDQELEKVKNAYEEKIEDLRGKSREQLTEKDQDNIAKIEGLRKLYSDSMAKRQIESEDMRQAQAQSLRAQIDKERQVGESQKAEMKRQFEDTLQGKSRNFEDFSTQTRDEMQKSLSKSQEKMNQKHQQELGYIVQDRDRSKLESETKLGQIKGRLENQLKDERNRSQLEKQKVEDNWQTHYKNKELELGELDKRRSEELKFARMKMRDQFQDTFQKKTDSIDRSFENLKENVNDRMENEVRATKQENLRVKAGEVARTNTMRRLTDLEKRELIFDYENRMQGLNDTNKGQLEQLKELNQKRIGEVNDKNSNILRESTQRFKTSQIIANDRHTQDRDRILREKQTTVDNLSMRTQDRVEKILKGTNESQRVQMKLHAENVNNLKDSYQSELAKQRETQLEQLKETYNRMESRLRDTEIKSQQRLDSTVENYEAKLNQIKDQYEIELKNQRQAYESRLGNQKKEFDRSLKTEEVKTQSKYQDLQQVHEKELDRVERRHQEQVASLVQKMNYHAKKS
jgi:hypothetical protein